MTSMLCWWIFSPREAPHLGTPFFDVRLRVARAGKIATMAKVTVLGAGVCGLAAGMLLARDGHEVTLLERDEAPIPESNDQAWEGWSRDGVTQFRQAHFLAPAGSGVLREELPDVLEDLVAAGALRFDALSFMPPYPDGSPAAQDERFVTYTARRPVIERVFAQAAVEQPGVEVRRGVSVSELLMHERDGTPHVTGVRLGSGEELHADLVVDATGRGSQLPRWLAAAGVAPMHEESEDCGFIYYGRFFRSADGSTPQPTAPLVCPLGTFSVLTLPSDNGTWAVAVYISSGDRPLKRMREADAWRAVVEACPLHAHWLEGEPISGMMAMGGVLDRYRRPIADGKPPFTGLALLADAWACTNPSLGRGISLGLMHAKHLRDTVDTHLDDPLEFALAWDAVTEEKVTPWYRDTVEEDRDRLREMEALRDGRVPEQVSELRSGLLTAMIHDPALFKAFLESRCCLTPLNQLFARDGVADHIRDLAAQHERIPFPGPSREDLLAMLA
jgi:2-polyprenyl-6-methoxyphenol hydroxylase-like FAD-dependent oxidoreductase